jgi:hypothetical protein
LRKVYKRGTYGLALLVGVGSGIWHLSFGCVIIRHSNDKEKVFKSKSEAKNLDGAQSVMEGAWLLCSLAFEPDGNMVYRNRREHPQFGCYISDIM